MSRWWPDALFFYNREDPIFEEAQRKDPNLLT